MSHLTPDELIDAVEATLAPARHAHLQECGRCREDVEQLAIVLRETRAADVPEPSPLFWEHFSDRVRSAIAAEPLVPPRLARWFQWPVLAPVGALALLVLALASAVPQGAADLWRVQLAMRSDASANSAGDTAADLESRWMLVSDLVGDLDVDAAEDAGIALRPGRADEAVLQLSAAEQQELVRLLREELQRPGG